METEEMSEDIRWLQRLNSYQNALATLERIAEVCKGHPLSELEMLGLIQAFEFTHELAWKLFKDFFEAKGQQDIFGSRDATRLAFRENLIVNGEVWMDMIIKRNLSSHTYDNETAETIARLILESYIEEFKALRTRLTEPQPADGDFTK